VGNAAPRARVRPPPNVRPAGPSFGRLMASRQPATLRVVDAQPRTAKVVVVMPAYNAAETLERTYADIPHDLVDHIILVDDVSRDETVAIAKRLGLEVVVHRQNLGYGGNQKTCYDRALEEGGDVVVMLHPDYQYDATRIPALIAPILSGRRDLMLGSRFLGDPLAGGMPRWKFVSNRFLTIVENVAFGLHLSEYHTGLRAYSRHLLETIPYHLNSNDFVFDQELIAQVVAGGMRNRIGEIAVPTRYFEEASSVGFRRSVVYGLSTLRVVLRYLLHRIGVRRSLKLTARRAPATAAGHEPTIGR
jgi:glycosyltransferase involved in cell wall biosynthesis